MVGARMVVIFLVFHKRYRYVAAFLLLLKETVFLKVSPKFVEMIYKAATRVSYTYLAYRDMFLFMVK